MASQEELQALVATLVELRRELDATKYAITRSVEAFGNKWPPDAIEILKLTDELMESLVRAIDGALAPHADLVEAAQPETYVANKDQS